ncbi:MAG: hypothetical protein JHC98_05765 [Thermoleophilaceae bacterium]|nr:hypothetical protein [Thermoleophilaceae bacterium]
MAAVATKAPARGLDPTFSNDGISIAPAAGKGADATVSQLARRPDGGWVVAGYTRVETERTFQLPLWSIAAYTADGQPDKRFGRNGRILRADPGGLASLDGAEPPVVAVQRDGKILVAGLVNDVSDKERDSYLDEDCDCVAYLAALLVVRYRTDGKLDRSFGHDGKALVRGLTKTATENGFPGALRRLVIDRAGRITIVGDTTYLWTKNGAEDGDQSRLIAYRLTGKGKLDRSFGNRGRVLHKLGSGTTNFFPDQVRALPDGRVVVAGGAQRYVKRSWQAGVGRTILPRSGKLDAASDWIAYPFGKGEVSTSSVDIASDGKIVVMARRERDTGPANDAPYSSVVARFSARGTLDTSFGSRGLLDLTSTAGFTFDATPIVRALPGGSVSAVMGIGDEAVGIVDISANGTPSAPVPLAFPLAASEELSISDVVAHGSHLILAGTNRVKEQQRVFLARFRQ